MRAMKAGRYGNYWSKTASYAAISDQIELNFDGTKDAIIRMLSGERVDVDVLSFFIQWIILQTGMISLPI